MKLTTYSQFTDKKPYFDHKIVNNMADLQRIVSNYTNSSGYIFRGVNEAKYKMYSSAQRKLTYSTQTEFQKKIKHIIQQTRSSQNICDYFCQRNIPINDFLLLGLVQHFGGPSPFIDFTDDINSALFFATDRAVKPANLGVGIDDYISIYIINKNNPEFCSIQQVMETGAQNVSTMLVDLGDDLKRVDTTQVCEEMRNLTYSQFNNIPYILVLGDSRGCVDISIPAINFTCSYNITNPNIKSQKGLFLVNFDSDRPIEEVIKNHLSCYPPQIICADIHKSLIQEIIKTYCTQNNINSATIYPQTKETANLEQRLKLVGII